jgi:hypothetical protein
MILHYFFLHVLYIADVHGHDDMNETFVAKLTDESRGIGDCGFNGYIGGVDGI